MIPVYRKPLKLYPNAKRVVARYFVPEGEDRIKHVIEKILKLSPAETKANCQQVLTQYSDRHRSITKILLKNFERVLEDGKLEIKPDKFSEQQKLLLGAYFTMEYSIESAAFFNPSIVEDPDQSGASSGEK